MADIFYIRHWARRCGSHVGRNSAGSTFRILGIRKIKDT